MTRHIIEPNEQSLHGYFSVELPPILTIAPGDTVQVRTLDAGWGLEPPSLDRQPRKRFAPPTDAPLQGHALCGPIAIHGAQLGMTLGVAIETVRTGPWGWT